MLHKTKLLTVIIVMGLLALTASAQSSRLKSSAHHTTPAATATVVKNTWRGLTPL
jgi:hypothetical protein